MAGDLKNIYYINFVPDGSGIDRETQSKLDAFKKNVELTCQFMNVKANISVKDKIVSGQLKNEAVATAAYKAKVVTYLASNTPWYVLMFIGATNETDTVQDGGTFCYE
ncbi:hypothetical protein ACHAPI_006059 [Fusarium lateritium]